MKAVRAPRSPDDASPWIVYANGDVLGRCGDDKVPAEATLEYADEAGVAARVEDGVYYRVLIDGRDGVGVRNGPLTSRSPARPWAVSTYNSLNDVTEVDIVSDASVEVLSPYDA